MGSFSGGGGQVQETAEEREMAKIASEKWADYQARFKPRENQLIDRVRKLGSQREYQKNIGRANTEISLGMDGPTISTAQGELGGGATLGQATDRTAISGTGRGEAKRAARTGTEERHRGGTKSLVALGRGIEGAGLRGLSHSASLSSARQRAEDTINAAEDADTMQALGTLGGFAAYRYGRKGTNPDGGLDDVNWSAEVADDPGELGW